MDCAWKDIAAKLFEQNPALLDLDIMQALVFNERIRDTGVALRILQQYREIQSAHGRVDSVAGA